MSRRDDVEGMKVRLFEVWKHQRSHYPADGEIDQTIRQQQNLVHHLQHFEDIKRSRRRSRDGRINRIASSASRK